MSDIDVLARTIYGEARNQPFEGQVAVAYVIRTRSEEREQSISEVCLSPNQFSCWNQNDPNRKIIEFVGMDKKAFQIAFGIACLVTTGMIINPVKGANHYHTIEAPIIHGKAIKWPPRWATQMEVIKVIGDHKFLKEMK